MSHIPGPKEKQIRLLHVDDITGTRSRVSCTKAPRSWGFQPREAAIFLTVNRILCEKDASNVTSSHNKIILILIEETIL